MICIRNGDFSSPDGRGIRDIERCGNRVLCWQGQLSESKGKNGQSHWGLPSKAHSMEPFTQINPQHTWGQSILSNPPLRPGLLALPLLQELELCLPQPAPYMHSLMHTHTCTHTHICRDTCEDTLNSFLLFTFDIFHKDFLKMQAMDLEPCLAYKNTR